MTQQQILQLAWGLSVEQWNTSCHSKLTKQEMKGRTLHAEEKWCSGGFRCEERRSADWRVKKTNVTNNIMQQLAKLFWTYSKLSLLFWPLLEGAKFSSKLHYCSLWVWFSCSCWLIFSVVTSTLASVVRAFIRDICYKSYYFVQGMFRSRTTL